MAMSIKDAAKLVSGAKVSGSGNYIVAGRGTLVVREWIYKPDAFNGPTVICEFKVETSHDLPGATEGGKPVYANAPGTTCSFTKMIGPGKNQEFFAGHVKTLLNVLDGDESGDLGELLEKVCGEAQGARGLRVNYEATINKKKNGEPVTAIKWSAYPNDEASVASGLAFLAGA
jgi:hypothetical protein